MRPTCASRARAVCGRKSSSGPRERDPMMVRPAAQMAGAAGSFPGKITPARGVLGTMSPLALSLRFLQAQPDSRLVALARDGHEPAFEALVRRYRSELLSYCRRMQPQTASAEDALQQTFLQALRAPYAGA